MEWHDYATRNAARGHTVVGTVKVLGGVASPQLGNDRDILVYLPPSYANEDRRYPVIYMHDGQNLFDQIASYAGEWQVDETMEAAARLGLEAIVVGIPNAGVERLHEYSPFVDRRDNGGKGDHYLAFITETVKPIIDRELRTLPERVCTGILGSSMGGLISLYGFFRHPAVFGFAGVMSPSLWFANRAIFAYLEKAPRVPGKIYLDMGTKEGVSALGDVRRMQALLRRKGYRPGQDLLYVEEPGAYHQEAAWARRLGPALRFLLDYPAQAAQPRLLDVRRRRAPRPAGAPQAPTPPAGLTS